MWYVHMYNLSHRPYILFQKAETTDISIQRDWWFDGQYAQYFCEARRASHCHSPQTIFSSNSTCCVLSTQKLAMHVVVYADGLTTQHSIVDIVHWSWSYWLFWYPRWHVECFWPALAAHWISSASHTSVLPQHPRRKIVPYRVGWNHHTSDYHG